MRGAARRVGEGAAATGGDNTERHPEQQVDIDNREGGGRERAGEDVQVAGGRAERDGQELQCKVVGV